MAAQDDSSEILHDFSPMYRQYKDGRVERLIASPEVPPCQDSVTGVRSKDVVIDLEIPLSVRVYLPDAAVPGKKLPLMVFFHGGGFVIESAFGALYHAHLNATTAEANVVAVSVEYRRAPEFPLPTAYEDSWLAIKWIASGSGGDEWINEFADLNRVYISGDSAGGNIAHYVSLRASVEALDSINLTGVILNCPFFGGEESHGNEKDHPVHGKEFQDKVWNHVWGGSAKLDDPRINPAKDENLSKLKPIKVLVFTAEKDFLRERSFHYKESLIKSGWEGELELVEGEGEEHVYSVLYPNNENSKGFMKKVSSFINH